MQKLFSIIILFTLTSCSNFIFGQSLSQSCDINYFRAFYSAGGVGVTSLRDVTIAYDSNFIAVGRTGNNAYILKVERGGNIISQKFFYTSTNAEFFRLVNTADSGLLVMAYSNYIIPDGGNICIVKLDKALNILWSNKYYVMSGAQSNYSTQMDIVAADGNNSIFCSNYDPKNILITKIDGFGNLIWQKKIATTLTRIDTHSLVVKDDFIYLSYNTFNINTSTAYLAKFSISDGSLTWSKSYATSAGNKLYFNKVTANSNNELVVNGIKEEFPENYGFQTITYLDTSGNSLRSASIIRPFKQQYSDLSDFTTMSNDGSLTGVTRYDGSYYDTLYLASVDANLNLIWAKKYAYNDKQTIRQVLTDFANESFIFGEFISNWPYAIQVIKTNSGGDISGCLSFIDQAYMSIDTIASTI